MPSRGQSLLIKAAMLEPERALAAWQTWLERHAEPLDSGSRRLLPLVHLNLAAPGAQLRHATAEYETARVRTALFLRALIPTIRVILEVGIEIMVLKGAALASDQYGQLYARQMGDLDLLVLPQDVDKTVERLEASGWSRRGRLPANRSLTHACSFRHTSGRVIDLHWHVHAEARWAGADASIWQASVPTNLMGVPVRVPRFEDMFLHVCVHGARWSPIPPCRWVHDAFWILRNAGRDFDWQRVGDEAGRLEVSESAMVAIACLKELAPDRMPSRLPAALESDVRRPALAQRAKVRPPNARSFRMRLALHGDLYRRMRRSGAYPDRIRTAAAVLVDAWGLERAWDIPSAAVSRVSAYARGLIRLGATSPPDGMPAD